MGFETCLRPLAGLLAGEYCWIRPCGPFLRGLALGEWSISCREALGGDLGSAENPCKAALLLARFLRASGEEALASVDCDQRFRLPKPSPDGRSDESSALLLLRLLCDVDVPASRKAISDVSRGLCEPIGSTALSPGEVSEALRLIVPADDVDADFDREEMRWCLEGATVLGLLSAETEALLPCIMASAVEIRCRRTVLEDHEPPLQPYDCQPGAPGHVARTLSSCADGNGAGANGLIREDFRYTSTVAGGVGEAVASEDGVPVACEVTQRWGATAAKRCCRATMDQSLVDVPLCGATASMFYSGCSGLQSVSCFQLGRKDMRAPAVKERRFEECFVSESFGRVSCQNRDQWFAAWPGKL